MVLDLVQRYWQRRHFQNVIQVVPAVVTYANRTRLPLLGPALERKPLLLPRLCPTSWPVQQHQVDVWEFQLRQRLLQRRSGCAGVEPSRNFRGHEVFIAPQTLARQRGPDALLVAICTMHAQLCEHMHGAASHTRTVDSSIAPETADTATGNLEERHVSKTTRGHCRNRAYIQVLCRRAGSPQQKLC